jgi:hypothetical protein
LEAKEPAEKSGSKDRAIGKERAGGGQEERESCELAGDIQETMF